MFVHQGPQPPQPPALFSNCPLWCVCMCVFVCVRASQALSRHNRQCSFFLHQRCLAIVLCGVCVCASQALSRQDEGEMQRDFHRCLQRLAGMYTCVCVCVCVRGGTCTLVCACVLSMCVSLYTLAASLRCAHARALQLLRSSKATGAGVLSMCVSLLLLLVLALRYRSHVSRVGQNRMVHRTYRISGDIPAKITRGGQLRP